MKTVKYNNQSILSKVGYNSDRSILTTSISDNITESLDFNPFNPFNSFDNYEYDEMDPLTTLVDTTHSYSQSISERIVNFNSIYDNDKLDPRLETICNGLLDVLNVTFGFKLGLDTNNNVKMLHYILNNALSILQFIIVANANELIKQMVRNTNAINKSKKSIAVNHDYKIAFNHLQSNDKTEEFINAFNNVIKSDKENVRSAIIIKLKTKNETIAIFEENSIPILCKTIISLLGLDIDELKQELLYVALEKAQKI